MLGLVLLGALLAGIFVGFPIAFTLIILSVVFGYIGFGDTVFYLMVFQTIGLMKEETLAAVPLFIFMGHVLEQAGLMERLFKSFQLILAPVRGSLYLGVLLTATIFATATGHHRRLGDGDGHDGGARHDAGRLRSEALGRHDRRRRHARHPDPAERDARGDGPDRGRLDHQAVRRRPLSGVAPGLSVHRLHDDQKPS